MLGVSRKRMNIVTPIFQKYREAARHLRNAYYIPLDRNDWDMIEDFDEISIMLFKHLVLGEFQLNREGFDWLAQPSKHFMIESSAEDLPLMINREGQSGYWDNPINKVKKGDLVTHFIDYFDWDSMDQIDFRYYRVRIVGSDKHPNLIGNDALIETIYADVYYQERG